MKGMLLDKGYKVARVEQTETPDMMAERCSNKKTKTTKFDKVVKREICQISSKGTLLHTAQMPESGNVFSCYLYALTEKVIVYSMKNYVYKIMNDFSNYQIIKSDSVCVLLKQLSVQYFSRNSTTINTAPN